MISMRVLTKTRQFMRVHHSTVAVLCVRFDLFQLFEIIIFFFISFIYDLYMIFFLYRTRAESSPEIHSDGLFFRHSTADFSLYD